MSIVGWFWTGVIRPILVFVFALLYDEEKGLYNESIWWLIFVCALVWLVWAIKH